MKLTTSLLFVFILLAASSFCYPQDDNPLKLRSASFGIGVYDEITTSYNNNLRGKLLNADIGFSLDEYIFSLFFTSGLEPVNPQRDNYFEIDFTFGWEYDATDWLTLEAHVGLGYLKHRYIYFTENPETDNFISIPLKLKGNIHVNDHLALGINPNLSFANFFTIIASINFCLQYYF